MRNEGAPVLGELRGVMDVTARTVHLDEGLTFKAYSNRQLQPGRGGGYLDSGLHFLSTNFLAPFLHHVTQHAWVQ